MALDWIKFGETLTVEMVLYRMMAAVILGAIIGIDREVKNRPAGMRTYVLVCVSNVDRTCRAADDILCFASGKSTNNDEYRQNYGYDCFGSEFPWCGNDCEIRAEN